MNRFEQKCKECETVFNLILCDSEIVEYDVEVLEHVIFESWANMALDLGMSLEDAKKRIEKFYIHNEI